MPNYIRSYRPVRIGRTTNRQLGFITPTPSDSKCPYFYERFIRHGVFIKENRAICELHNPNVICDYKHITTDGIPFCLRYWYGPKYEIVDEINEPTVHKVDDNGNLLYYEADGVTETRSVTSKPVVLPVSQAYPIDYVVNSNEPNIQFFSTQYEDTHEKIFGTNGNRLGWHHDV